MGIGAVALLILALRFGRTIVLSVLGLGVLVVVVLGAGALFTQSAANYQTARAATEAAKAATAASVGQTATTLVGGLLVGGLSVTLLVSLVVIAYLVFQLRETERGQALRFPRKKKQKRLDGPVVYIVETSPDDADERHPMEMIEWTSDDWRF
jgi:hypothetical protein